MRMESLKVKEPESKDVVKARITAYNKEDAEKAAELMARGWNHHSIKPIKPLGPPQNIVSYYVLLWN